MYGSIKVEQKVEYNVWLKRSQTKSRVQCMVETSSNKNSSKMFLIETSSNKTSSAICGQNKVEHKCGGNIVEQKVEYNVWSIRSRTKIRVHCVVEQKVEQRVECNVWSKHRRTKSRVHYVVET